ncbi:MAG TPA: response regulator [Gemmatimonadales bacterium]|nr:response regulator [Gemmatimonadales bacterium]
MPISFAVALQGWVTRQPRAWRSPDTDRTGLAPGSGTVLVVDDDRGVRRLTARMLRAEGYKTLEADSGPEALAILEREPGIHLLVTDIVMPEMHGLDLADQAQARLPQLRVLLMTGHAPELTVQLDARDERMPVLLKPFSKEQLSAKVRDALADHRQ